MTWCEVEMTFNRTCGNVKTCSRQTCFKHVFRWFQPTFQPTVHSRSDDIHGTSCLIAVHTTMANARVHIGAHRTSVHRRTRYLAARPASVSCRLSPCRSSDITNGLILADAHMLRS